MVMAVSEAEIAMGLDRLVQSGSGTVCVEVVGLSGVCGVAVAEVRRGIRCHRGPLRLKGLELGLLFLTEL